jgi:LuxR family maltose regulon positive regulatory protein
VHGKLCPPDIRDDSVLRAEVLEPLTASRHPITVISGPAGSGKTTLLAQWHQSDPDAAWFSIDGADNDAVLLWTGIIKSMRLALDGVDLGSLDNLLRAGPPAIDQVVASLQLALEHAGVPMRLFLDDVHLLTSRGARRSLMQFVRRLPDGVRIVMAGRGTAPLPLARLRLEGALIEVGGAELAMSIDETRELLDRSGIALEQDELELLHTRTEGWVASLRLASLALATSNENVSAFLASFAGTDRDVSEYLAAEVLERLTPEDQQFVLKTSLLRRLCGELCDAVTGGTGGAKRLPDIAQATALVIPLDRSGTWYRYHHLFGELLLATMERNDSANLQEAHRCAFDWYSERGDLDDAIYHGLRAGARDAAADILCTQWFELVGHGRLETVGNMLERFDDRYVLDYQPLTIVAAGYHALTGHTEEAHRFLSAAERSQHEGPPPDGSASMDSSLALMQAAVGLCGVDNARTAAQRAYELEPPDSPWRPFAAALLGLTLVWSGDDQQGAVFLEEAASSTPVNEMVSGYALAELAIIRLRRNEIDKAVEFSLEACRVAGEAGLDSIISGLAAHGAASLALVAAGRRPEARTHLETAIRGIPHLGAALPVDGVRVRLIAAEAALQFGEDTAAASWIRQAAELSQLVPDVGVLARDLADLELKVAAAHSDNNGDPHTDLALTPRELEILELLRTPLTTRQIGEELFLSRNTVKTHQLRIYRKLGVSSRSAAVNSALATGVHGRADPHESGSTPPLPPTSSVGARASLADS